MNTYKLEIQLHYLNQKTENGIVSRPYALKNISKIFAIPNDMESQKTLSNSINRYHPCGQSLLFRYYSTNQQLTPISVVSVSVAGVAGVLKLYIL